jgi:hypothetical protein
MFEDDHERGGFGSPFFFLEALAPMAVMTLMSMMSFGFILYLVARWRDNRAPQPDPQLGLKFALHFFRSNAYLMLLTGTTVLLFSMLGKDLGELREYIYRPAFGLIVPAAIVFGTMSVLLGKTNNYAYPAVGRLFAGYNLIVVGMAGFFAFVAGFVLLFQKGSSGNPGRVVWSMILVYTTAWAVQGALFGRQVLDAPPPPGTPPPPPFGGDVRPEPMQKPLA